ncbi:MAG: response regulator transcription factor [Verrucomicrobiota bacterium]
MRTHRILLVDDHPLMNEGLRQLLDSQPGLTTCGMAGSVQQAIALVDSTKPDLVITDLTLPGRNGLELIKDLGATHPELPIIVLSMHDELLYAERVLRAGGRGYVSKDSPAERIIEAIHCVLDGEVFASPAVTKHFLQAMVPGRGAAKPSFPLERLTDREIEVFELIGHAKSNHDISCQLGISPRTVDVHRAHIREKLGLEDGSALTRHAIRWVEVGMIGT